MILQYLSTDTCHHLLCLLTCSQPALRTLTACLDTSNYLLALLLHLPSLPFSFSSFFSLTSDALPDYCDPGPCCHLHLQHHHHLLLLLSPLSLLVSSPLLCWAPSLSLFFSHTHTRARTHTVTPLPSHPLQARYLLLLPHPHHQKHSTVQHTLPTQAALVWVLAPTPIDSWSHPSSNIGLL